MNINSTFIIINGFIWIFYILQFKKQALILYGEDGIRPLLTTMKNINKVTNYWTKFYTFPSLFWNISPSNNNIIRILNISIISSILTIFTIHRGLFLFINWLIYISFVSIGSEFLFYQWDSFLLEVTILSSIYHYTKYDRIIQLFFYYIFFKFNIIQSYRKYNNNWIWGNQFNKHLYTQPMPRKDNLYLFHQKFISKIINYYILFHELLTPFLVLLYPNTATISIILYSILSIMLNNITVLYLLYLNLGLFLCDYNLFYLLPTIDFDILYPVILAILIYTYLPNNLYAMYYHINNNYDFFNTVNLTKKKFIFYADDTKLIFNEKELFCHDFIQWHLNNSTILKPTINTWLNNFVKILVKKNNIIINRLNNPKYITIYLYHLEPNNFDNIQNNKTWKIVNRELYMKIKMEEH